MRRTKGTSAVSTLRGTAAGLLFTLMIHGSPLGLMPKRHFTGCDLLPKYSVG
jgi:hypothetical protein